MIGALKALSLAKRWGPLLIVVGVIIAGLWGLGWLVNDRAQARADLTLAERDKADMALVLEQQEQALAVHRVYVRQAQEDAERWAALEAELQNMEGRDAPLSNHMAAAAERLWPGRR